MGYCSDVSLILKDDIIEDFYEYIHRYYNDYQNVLTLVQECKQRLISNEGDVLCYWEFIKWNSDDLAVFVIEKFMDKLDRENKSDKYLFVRMGEEWDDIEERGDFGNRYGDNPFCLEVVREITFWNKS